MTAILHFSTFLSFVVLLVNCRLTVGILAADSILTVGLQTVRGVHNSQFSENIQKYSLCLKWHLDCSNQFTCKFAIYHTQFTTRHNTSVMRTFFFPPRRAGRIRNSAISSSGFFIQYGDWCHFECIQIYSYFFHMNIHINNVCPE